MLRGLNESLDWKPLIASMFCLTVFALFAVGCGGNDEPIAAAKSKPKFFDPMSLELNDPDLVEGRRIWMDTCTACHLRGLVGAPKIGDTIAWKPRIDQGLETLYEHAINGYIGPELTEMPARGGFPDLTDEEIKKAVRFVVAASK